VINLTILDPNVLLRKRHLPRSENRITVQATPGAGPEQHREHFRPLKHTTEHNKVLQKAWVLKPTTHPHSTLKRQVLGLILCNWSNTVKNSFKLDIEATSTL
jgi:hypothetical protein